MPKRIAIIFIVALIGLVGCSPRTRIDRSVEAITNRFTARIGDRTLTPASGQIPYSTPNFDMYFQVDTEGVFYFLQNKGADTLRLVFDESTFVLPDGTTSRTVPDNVTWVTRNDPQPPSIIPPNASVRGYLAPVNNLTFGSFGNSGLGIADFFGYPNANPVSFRLVLALDVAGQRTTRDFTFATPAYVSNEAQ